MFLLQFISLFYFVLISAVHASHYAFVKSAVTSDPEDGLEAIATIQKIVGIQVNLHMHPLPELEKETERVVNAPILSLDNPMSIDDINEALVISFINLQSVVSAENIDLINLKILIKKLEEKIKPCATQTSPNITDEHHSKQNVSGNEPNITSTQTNETSSSPAVEQKKANATENTETISTENKVHLDDEQAKPNNDSSNHNINDTQHDDSVQVEKNVAPTAAAENKNVAPTVPGNTLFTDNTQEKKHTITKIIHEKSNSELMYGAANVESVGFGLEGTQHHQNSKTKSESAEEHEDQLIKELRTLEAMVKVNHEEQSHVKKKV